MLINVISGNLRYFNSFALVCPFIQHKTLLRSAGIKTKVFSKLDPRVTDCDILIIDSKFFRELWKHGPDQPLSQISALSGGSHKTLWFNTGDSTGLIQKPVVDIVDRYYKNQLLRDRSAYEKSFYGGRIFTDYYHTYHSISDPDPYWSSPLSTNQISKLRVSWNLGLHPFVQPTANRIASVFPKLTKLLLTIRRTAGNSPPPFTSRRSVATARMNITYDRPSVAFQRQKVSSAMNRLGIHTSRVSSRDYSQELFDSRFAISPFGWGEVCIRDFEAILSGCALVKPDMSHVDTWPNIYLENETYIPFSWDVDCLDEWFDNFFSEGRDYGDIVQNALGIHQQTIGDPTGSAFLAKITEIILDLDLSF